MQFILTVKSCQDPGTPWRGNKNGNLQVGQTLHFSCHQCYKLKGSPTRTCQSDLSWSGSQPTCTGMFEDFSFAPNFTLAPNDFHKLIEIVSYIPERYHI
jgi:hypothetical protein